MRHIHTLLSNCWWGYFNQAGEKDVEHLSLLPGELPGWQLWLKKRRGVYEFKLSDCAVIDDVEISTFSIKYYPCPDEEVFEDFAVAEQVVRLSDYFDDALIQGPSHGEGCACSALHHGHEHGQRSKGIPRFATRDELNPSLFTVGDVRFHVRQEDSKLIRAELVGLDRLVEYSQDGISIEHDGESIQVVKPGTIDRKIPAYELCWDLFDTLLNDVLPRIGVQHKESNRSTENGMVFYTNEGGECWSKESERVVQVRQTFVY